MSRDDYYPVKLRSLAKALRVEDELFGVFAQAVESLRQQGCVSVDGAGAVSAAAMPKRLTGVYSANRKGFGFVRPEGLTTLDDLFIPAGNELDAVNGDRVVARVHPRGMRNGQKRYVGKIVEVITRGANQFVGQLFKEGKQWFVQPDGKRQTEIIAVDDPSAKNCKVGSKVVVEILTYANQEYYANGVIVEKLGKSGTSSAELKAIMVRYGIEEKFSRTALNETRNSIKNFNPQAAIDKGLREDIRNQTIITIDPADARDFDDAISIKKLPDNCWLLGVHIADVSHFVAQDAHLDKEARDRATSVYLPQHVTPMLPELLSNGVCSLQGGQDRFAKSAYIKLDGDGNVMSTRFANSVINSTQRLTYEDADLILDGDDSKGYDRKAVQLVKKMDQLARILQKRRREAGMLRLDLPKAELVYDDKGRVVDAQPESNTFSHVIIEMFMLEANDAVGQLLDSLNVEFLRRIHPEPDALATGDMARVIKMCGYVIPKTINRKGVQQLLESVEGKPESFMINLAILRSMQKAEYRPTHIGHYAIASEHYCHFTSPIRRYPDLTVHRLLNDYIQGRLNKETARDYPGYAELDALGIHCSERERNAEAAENDLRDLKIMQMLLTRHLNDETLGVVTSITNFGLFVQLEKYLVEGLITPQDARHYAEGQAKKGKGRKNRKKAKSSLKRGNFTETCPFKLGQEIKIRIVEVNLSARTVDLIPVE